MGFNGFDIHEIADALQQQVADKLRLEFELYNHCITAERKGDGVTAYRTNFDDDDPRHDWTDADWLAAAKKELERE